MSANTDLKKELKATVESMEFRCHEEIRKSQDARLKAEVLENEARRLRLILEEQ